MEQAGAASLLAQAQVLAVDPGTYAGAAWWRSDYGAGSLPGHSPSRPLSGTGYDAGLFSPRRLYGTGYDAGLFSGRRN